MVKITCCKIDEQDKEFGISAMAQLGLKYYQVVIGDGNEEFYIFTDCSEFMRGSTMQDLADDDLADYFADFQHNSRRLYMVVDDYDSLHKALN